MWRQFLDNQALTSSDLSHAMVALDLPGHGLSSPLPAYTPNDILNAIAEFILLMTQRHTSRSAGDPTAGSIVVMGHDWGACVTARLAADMPSLADRFIVSNFPIVRPPSLFRPL